MQNNASKLNVHHGIQIPLLAKVGNNGPSQLRNTKSTFNILANNLLHHGKMLMLLIWWVMNSLYKINPFRINVFSQQVISRINDTI
jgi:hypothetical protein